MRGFCGRGTKVRPISPLASYLWRIMLKVGDTVVARAIFDDKEGVGKPGIVIEIRESEIYDRGMRIVVAWQAGGQSYEKASSLIKLNDE